MGASRAWLEATRGPQHGIAWHTWVDAREAAATKEIPIVFEEHIRVVRVLEPSNGGRLGCLARGKSRRMCRGREGTQRPEAAPHAGIGTGPVVAVVQGAAQGIHGCALELLVDGLSGNAKGHLEHLRQQRCAVEMLGDDLGSIGFRSFVGGRKGTWHSSAARELLRCHRHPQHSASRGWTSRKRASSSSGIPSVHLRSGTES